MAAVNTRAPSEKGVIASPSDWPKVVVVRAWLLGEGDRWIALAEDFDIAGQGRNEREAAENMGELLADYLNLCVSEGMSFAAAQRPVPLRTKLRLRALHAAAPLRRLHDRLAAAYQQKFDLDMSGHVQAHGG